MKPIKPNTIRKDKKFDKRIKRHFKEDLINRDQKYLSGQSYGSPDSENTPFLYAEGGNEALADQNV